MKLFQVFVWLLTAVTVVNAQTTATTSSYCPTPELSDFDAWTKDVREGIQNAGLPSIPSANCPVGDITNKKVLMIGVDGLRAGAAAMLPLPNFRRLERMGTFSYWAHVQQTATALSGPGWVR